MAKTLNRDLPPQMDWIPERQRKYFPYTAHTLWPGIEPERLDILQHPIPYMGQQIDWVEAVQTMENWLEQSVGLRYSSWVWAEHLAISSWHCGVAFHRDRDRTLFLLRWDNR